MITLELQRGKYLRVRGGVKKRDIEREFGFPVNCEVFNGAIIPVMQGCGGYCYAEAGDDYFSVALREGVDEEKLKELNGHSPIYPTKKLWLP